MHNAQLVRSVTFALLLFLLPSSAHSQEAVVTTAAPIFLMPDVRRTPLRTAAANSRLRVIEEQPDGWVKVEFRDPQFGMRIGFIEARYIKISRPELVPLDLSVGKEPERATSAPEPAMRPREVVVPQPATSQRFNRGWIDVNIGVAAAADSRYGSVFEGIIYRETATFTADYRSPLGAEFDFGGGMMFTPEFGLGVSFAGTAHQDNAQLGIRIPHPLVFDAYASDSAPTEAKLARVESSVNIHAMFVASPSDSVSVRVFGGPSYFRIRQDAVSDIEFFRSIIPNEVEILRYDTEVVEFEDGGGWGFHAGGDVSFFFNRVIGLGCFAKYSRGTVEVFDPFSRENADFKTGGFQSGGGLRLRF
jgi:hypothetical protein